MITLGPYGFYWFQLQERDKSEPVTPRAVPEFETLVVPVNSNWVSLARERGVFERDVLPGFLSRTRWYPDHNPKQIKATLTSAVPFSDIGDNRPWIAFFETTRDDVTTRYVMPMQIEWVRFDRERFNPKALAAVRQGAREGTLLDVATEQIFIGLFLRGLSQNLVVDENNLRLEFKATSRFADYTIKEPQRIRTIEQSNSTALVDNQYVAKIYRRLQSGTSPEIEIGHYLTEVARFANAPALLGSVELIEGDHRSALGVLHVGVHFADNPWWLDVLEWGQASPHAVSFDIDWDQLAYRARGGVLLPILGASYGEALERGEIEPGAGPDMVALLHAIELVEHALELAGRNAAALVGDSKHHLITLAAALDRDCGLRRGIFGGIVEQIEQHLLEQHGIELEHREIGGQHQLHLVRREDLARAPERAADDLAEIVQRRVRHDGAGLQFGHAPDRRGGLDRCRAGADRDRAAALAGPPHRL